MKMENLVNFLYDFMIKCYFRDILFLTVKTSTIK